MKALLQKVTRGKVSIGNETVGEIGPGAVVFLGVTHGDSEKDAEYLAEKIATLRIFPSEKNYFDLSLTDKGYAVLAVSQFTLYAECVKGRRPDFIAAAKPDLAEPLYNFFVQKLREKGLKMETGRFGADMLVEIANDGPVTLMIESPAA